MTLSINPANPIIPFSANSANSLNDSPKDLAARNPTVPTTINETCWAMCVPTYSSAKSNT